jgi:hypothetical protein
MLCLDMYFVVNVYEFRAEEGEDGGPVLPLGVLKRRAKPEPKRVHGFPIGTLALA